MLLGLMFPVDELSLVHGSQTSSDLRHDFQRQLCLETARAFDEVPERLPLYKLHRVEVTAPGSAQVKHRCNV